MRSWKELTNPETGVKLSFLEQTGMGVLYGILEHPELEGDDTGDSISQPPEGILRANL